MTIQRQEEIKVSCNLCGEDSYKTFLSVDGKRVVQCRKCEFVYVDPQFEGDEKRSFDKKMFFDSMISQYNSPEKPRVRSCQERLEIIEKAHKKGKILDVGCSVGFFLDEARRQGWDTYGIEPSILCSNYARTNLGLKVFTGDFEEDNLSGLGVDGFDVVTFWGVLGHLPDPKRALKLAYKLVKEGGIIAIETPNIESPIFKLFKKKWYHLSIANQNYFFSLNTLSTMLVDCGFTVNLSVLIARAYSYRLFTRKACPLNFGSRWFRFLSSIVNHFIITLLRSGDHIFILGIKN